MRKRTSMGTIILVLALGFFAVVPGQVQAVDDQYRVSLPFEGIEVTRQVSEALQQKDYSKLKNAVDLLEPVFGHLNREYPKGGENLTLRQDIMDAIPSREEETIRRTTVRFLYYNLRDLLRLGHEFARAGNASRAGVYVKKSLLNYKATLQPFIRNQDEKMGAIRTVSTGIQKLNQAVGSPGTYGKELEKVKKGLKALFPEATD